MKTVFVLIVIINGFESGVLSHWESLSKCSALAHQLRTRCERAKPPLYIDAYCVVKQVEPSTAVFR